MLGRNPHRTNKECSLDVVNLKYPATVETSPCQAPGEVWVFTWPFEVLSQPVRLLGDLGGVAAGAVDCRSSEVEGGTSN